MGILVLVNAKVLADCGIGEFFYEVNGGASKSSLLHAAHDLVPDVGVPNFIEKLVALPGQLEWKNVDDSVAST